MRANYEKRLNELEKLVGEISMVILSPRSKSSKLEIIRNLLRQDIIREVIIPSASKLDMSGMDMKGGE